MEFYVSPKLARRTYSFECSQDILGAPDPLHGKRTKPASNAGLMDGGRRMTSGTMDDVTRLAIGEMGRIYSKKEQWYSIVARWVVSWGSNTVLVGV